MKGEEGPSYFAVLALSGCWDPWRVPPRVDHANRGGGSAARESLVLRVGSSGMHPGAGPELLPNASSMLVSLHVPLR